MIDTEEQSTEHAEKDHPDAGPDIARRPHQYRRDRWRNENHDDNEGSLLAWQCDAQCRVRAAMPNNYGEMECDENG